MSLKDFQTEFFTPLFHLETVKRKAGRIFGISLFHRTWKCSVLALSSPDHDRQEPMNGGNLRSSASPTSTYKWTQSHTHITVLQKITQEDNFCVVVHLFCKQLRLIFLGKWWNTALNFAAWKMGKWKQLLEVRVLVGKSQMSGSSLVARQHTEWGLSCRPVWGTQRVQDGKKDFLNDKSKAEKCSGVSLEQQWPGLRSTEDWSLLSSVLLWPSTV